MTEEQARHYKAVLEEKNIEAVQLVFDVEKQEGIGTKDADLIKIMRNLMIKRCENVINGNKE